MRKSIPYRFSMKLDSVGVSLTAYPCNKTGGTCACTGGGGGDELLRSCAYLAACSSAKTGQGCCCWLTVYSAVSKLYSAMTLVAVVISYLVFLALWHFKPSTSLSGQHYSIASGVPKS